MEKFSKSSLAQIILIHTVPGELAGPSTPVNLSRIGLRFWFVLLSFLEADYKALAWCSNGFQRNTSLLKMRVPTAISLSANWMQPLGSWRAAIKSSVRLNVSGPEKQHPINSTEPDVPKRMDLAKSLWKCFFWNEKHSERKEELACAYVLYLTE